MYIIPYTGGEHKDMWLYAPPVYMSHNIFEEPSTLGILARFNSTLVSMTALANAYNLRLFPFPSEIGAANERWWCISAFVYAIGSVYQDMWLYTPPVYISHNILEGPITLGILDRFGSTIASRISPAHADIPQLFSGPPEVCAANERRWCI